MEFLLHTDDVLLIQPLDRAQFFGGVSIGCFPWSSVDSVLHTDDVRSGRTIDGTTVPPEKFHKF
jgi:hypothetical protein